MNKNVDFVFMIMFSGLLFYSRVITRTIFSLKIWFTYLSVQELSNRKFLKMFKSHSTWSL